MQTKESKVAKVPPAFGVKFTRPATRKAFKLALIVVVVVRERLPL